MARPLLDQIGGCAHPLGGACVTMCFHNPSRLRVPPSLPKHRLRIRQTTGGDALPFRGIQTLILPIGNRLWLGKPATQSAGSARPAASCSCLGRGRPDPHSTSPILQAGHNLR
jgi:hypothetical protein